MGPKKDVLFSAKLEIHNFHMTQILSGRCVTLQKQSAAVNIATNRLPAHFAGCPEGSVIFHPAADVCFANRQKIHQLKCNFAAAAAAGG